MKHIPTIIIAIILFLPLHVSAQTKEIIAEGAYNMGDGETPSVADSRAILQAKRTALEQAGTYVESYSKVKNFQLTEDEIKVLASGLMEVTVLDKKRTVVGDGIHFWVKIKAMVQIEKMEEMAKRVKEKSVIDDYKNIQEAYDKSQKDIEELKRQLAQAKGEKEKKQIEAKITDEEQLFQANEWFEKGYDYAVNKKEYDKAIEAFTSAITLNPNHAQAYTKRGILYGNKGQFERAVEDFNSAITLNPNLAAAYNGRGAAYGSKGQYDRTMEDFNKAIALNPNYAAAYNNRGVAYGSKGQYDRAIDDFNNAIVLEPNDAKAYNNRGSAYHGKGHYDRAIEDYNKAIALDPNDAAAYNNRGFTYFNKGQYDMAMEDCNRAIALNPNDPTTYSMRGAAYYAKGNVNKAISDFQKACDMGNQQGCEFLQSALKNR